MTTLVKTFKSICKQHKSLEALAFEVDTAFTRGQLMELLAYNEEGKMTEHEEEVFATLAEMM